MDDNVIEMPVLWKSKRHRELLEKVNGPGRTHTQRGQRGFAWTEGQAQALSMLRAWSSSRPARWLTRNTNRLQGWEIFGLFGYAGTGKTTVIFEWARAQRVRSVLFLAPTHKAVGVLGEQARRAGVVGQLGCQTLQSALRYRRSIDEVTGESVFAPDWTREPPIKDARFVVVDECSMISPELWDCLCQARQHWGFELVLMGDALQLPPVNCKTSPSFESATTSIELTEVVRHGGELAQCVRRLRDSLLAGRPVLLDASSERTDPDGELVAWLSSGGFLAHALEQLRAGRQAKLLAYTNDTVDWINDALRRELLGEQAKEEYVAGEQLVVVKSYEDFEEGHLLFAEEQVQITGVELVQHPRWQLHCYKLETDCGLDVYTLGRRHRAAWRRKEREIVDDCRAKGKWGEVTRFREGFALLRPGYATTIHKAQGSTWQDVYLVQTDVTARDWSQDRRFERDQLLYVAYSRAAEHLHVRV